MANIKEIAKAIEKAFDEKKYTCFGVRTGRTAEVGEKLEPSHDWDIENDWFSDELLPGTCCTGIGGDFEDYEDEEIEKALAQHHKNYYLGEMTYIIGGRRSEYGNDPGEEIIADAEVIYIVETNS